MKFFLTIIFCVTFATVLGLTKHEIKEKFKAAHDKCQGDPATAIDETALKAFRDSKGEGTRPAHLDEHSLCVSKALGWQHADGSINKEYLKEGISATIDAAKVDEVFNDCTAEQANEIATAEHLHKCFFKYNTPEHHH